MNTAGRGAGFSQYLGALGNRLTAFADEPTDDEDIRLRKRVAISAGYVLTLLPLELPVLGQGHPLSWFLATTMPLVSVLNLLLLARTRQFQRYVNVRT